MTPVTPEARTVVVLGLGNPGRGYELTRHNMGFLTLDELSDRLSIPIQKIRHKSPWARGGLAAGNRAASLRPSNLSGENPSAVSRASWTFGDDDIGRVETSHTQKRAPAHGGMRSVIQHSRMIFRVRTERQRLHPLEKYVP